MTGLNPSTNRPKRVIRTFKKCTPAPSTKDASPVRHPFPSTQKSVSPAPPMSLTTSRKTNRAVYERHNLTFKPEQDPSDFAFLNEAPDYFDDEVCSFIHFLDNSWLKSIGLKLELM